MEISLNSCQTQGLDRVVLRSRKEVPEIVSYLNDTVNDTVNELRTLSYIIKDQLDIHDFTDTLNKDLPNGESQTDKLCLIKDIVEHCHFFLLNTKSKEIRLKVEVVKTDLCRLFHVDNIRQRLLCTYLGPGTEWLDNSNVNREGLGKGCNSKIVKDFDSINRAKPFDTLLLKRLLYERVDQAVVHRSPPIEKDFKTRVLLKIDEYESI